MKKKKKLEKKIILKESCIIEKLRSFIMVPYGLAIPDIEGSDKMKQKGKKRHGMIVETVL